jgi:hypothetical protein
LFDCFHQFFGSAFGSFVCLSAVDALFKVFLLDDPTTAWTEFLFFSLWHSQHGLISEALCKGILTMKAVFVLLVSLVSLCLSSNVFCIVDTSTFRGFALERKGSMDRKDSLRIPQIVDIDLYTVGTSDPNHVFLGIEAKDPFLCVDLNPLSRTFFVYLPFIHGSTRLFGSVPMTLRCRATTPLISSASHGSKVWTRTSMPLDLTVIFMLTGSISDRSFTISDSLFLLFVHSLGSIERRFFGDSQFQPSR